MIDCRKKGISYKRTDESSGRATRTLASKQTRHFGVLMKSRKFAMRYGIMLIPFTFILQLAEEESKSITMKKNKKLFEQLRRF